MNKLLFIGPMLEGTGNKSTALRIKSYFPDCILKSISDFENVSEFYYYICCNKISAILCLHAFRSSLFFQGECPVPYAVIFGGTDVNVFSKNSENKELMSRTLAGARAVVMFNENLKNVAYQIWPELVTKKKFVIPQAINCCAERIFERKECIITKYSFLNDFKTFTLIAGLRPEKDPQFLISAFQEWHDLCRPDVILTIIGPEINEEYSKNFHDYIKNYPSVQFFGRLEQDEVFQILRHSTALVNSSLNEGMSNTILEAMYFGVPVIARDIEGNRAIIQHRINGLLFHTPNEFIEMASELIKDQNLKRKLISSAKQYVDFHHNPQIEKQQYLNLINYLVE